MDVGGTYSGGLTGKSKNHELKIPSMGFPGGSVGIHLPMQETQARSLVWEDPICQGTIKLMHCNTEPAL